MERFSIKDFQNPENRFYPVYGWTWNDVITREGIKEQIDEMYKQNILGVYVIPHSKKFRPNTMVTNLQPEYLSDEYFELLSYAVEYADEKGIKFWIYDESGWPSGNANFGVTEDDASLSLVMIDDNGKPFTVPSFSDITNIKATEKFISLTHKAHKEKMGESFNKFAPFVFTDEPSIRHRPYTEAIKKLFKERTGNELSCEKIIAHNDPDFNIIYHDVCAEAFAENYFKPIKKWCNKNGMLHTGHIDREDEVLAYHYGGYHQPMRILRLLDVPGIDTIWGQIDKVGNNSFFPRLASSAAEQNSSGLSMTESMSVYGVSTYERFRYVVNYQLVRGINIINPLLLMYDNSGYYVLRQRPSYNQSQPGIEKLPEFNKYLASLSYITQCGKPDINCALYLPMCDFWADDENTQIAATTYEKIGSQIERNHGQFDIIDDDVILECNSEALKQGKIQIGRACYTKLYIPSEKYMPKNVKAHLEIFANGGGEIYHENDAHYFPLLEISGDNNNLRVHKRICDNNEIFLIFNQANEKVTASIEFPKDTYEIKTTGEKYIISKHYTFESGEIKIFVTGKVDGLSLEPHPTNELAQITNFEIKPLRKFEITKERAIYAPIHSEKTVTNCGDWKSILGDDFSGECEYKATFQLENTNDDIFLSLGDVKFSCEAFVNGKSIGTALMPPYNFLIKKEILKDNNELVINVSNTAANAFVHFELPEEWEQKHIGPYHAKAIEQEKKIVFGGLIGPVKLFKKE